MKKDCKIMAIGSDTNQARKPSLETLHLSIPGSVCASITHAGKPDAGRPLSLSAPGVVRVATLSEC